MSSPKGQHFLAREAYLRGFCAPGKQQVWLYRRGANPVLTNIVNVAKRNRLYSVELAGEYNDKLETFLAKIDGAAAGIFQRLRGASGGALTLSEKDLAELIQYVAIQFVRTPAFRSMLEKNGMYAAVSGRNLSDEQITWLRRIVPRDVLPSGVVNSDEEFRELWSKALCDVEAAYADKRSWLERMPQFAEGIALALWKKHLELIKVAGEYFITCDLPVVLDYVQNFETSDVYFPIGSHAALYFDRLQARVGPNPLTLPIRNVSGSDARTFNRRTMLSAEDELYGAVNRADIQKAFISIPRPNRFPLIGAAQLLGLPRD